MEEEAGDRIRALALFKSYVAQNQGCLEKVLGGACIDEDGKEMTFRSELQVPRYLCVMRKGKPVLSSVEAFVSYVAKDEALSHDIRREFIMSNQPVFEVAYSVLRLFAVPESFPLHQSSLYRTASVLGVDAASTMAVEALRVNPGDMVLDMCCAPGVKLALLSELVGEDGGCVLGLDVSSSRLDVACALVRKYQLNNVLLALADATKPFIIEDSVFETQLGAVWNKWSLPHARQRKQRARRRKTQRIPTELLSNFKAKWFGNGFTLSETLLFDKVLVDAECTHDGSLRHLRKFENMWGWKRVMDPGRLQNLQTLQRDLLLAGIRQLKPGGYLVYSTCSMCTAQNERIVEEVLNNWSEGLDMELAELPFKLRYDVTSESLISLNCDSLENGVMEPSFRALMSDKMVPAVAVPIHVVGAVDLQSRPTIAACRFEPQLSGTSGMFLCCLRKKGP